LEILNLENGTAWLSKMSEWNYHFMLRKIQKESRSKNMFNFSVSVCEENAKCSNVYVLFVITSENIK